MPKLSEVSKAPSSEVAKRMQSEMGTVADVKAPPAPKKKLGKLGG